jgi:hypothetical protein
LVQKSKREQNLEVAHGNYTSINVTGDNIETEVISPGDGGSDDKGDRSTVLQSNPPLSRKALTIFGINTKTRRREKEKKRKRSKGQYYHLVIPLYVSIVTLLPCICATSFQMTFIY